MGEIENGSTIISPEEKQRRSEMKKQRIAHEMNRLRSKSEKYIFINMYSKLSVLKPATVTKLIYLSTFAGYDNRLVWSIKSKKPVGYSDLPKILDVSRKTAYSFWKEISPEYISEDKNGCLKLNGNIFQRGKIDKRAYTSYQQIYFKGIRTLYAAVNGKYHKYLGYLFQLIPFINREWNVVCNNPFEEDIDLIELISIKDFCSRISYKDSSNISKFKKIYDTVRFNVNGNEQRFCTLTYNGLDDSTAKIVVNPNIFYVGSNKNRVEVLKLFFRD